ncbi:MAG TPA: hypothetical protein VD994_20435, partial [Prosthecobacter sp.]|nr:hypothetical protein [Prosthecobacter sp.]
YANLADGNFGAFNSIFPASGGMSPLATITTLSIISSLAVPSFNMIQVQAEQTRMMANARQVGTALKMFATDNEGRYPRELGELVEEKLLEESMLTVKDSKLGLVEMWLYDNTLTETSPGSAIVLASPLPIMKGTKQQRIVVHNDMSVEIIAEAEFQAQRGPGLQ